MTMVKPLKATKMAPMTTQTFRSHCCSGRNRRTRERESFIQVHLPYGLIMSTRGTTNQYGRTTGSETTLRASETVPLSRSRKESVKRGLRKPMLQGGKRWVMTTNERMTTIVFALAEG